jgi:Spy/CpxP family protein refolding chaperone
MASRLALGLGAVMLLSAPAWAQRPGGFGMGGGGGVMLLGNQGVQKELGLSSEQTEKVAKYVEETSAKRREQFQKLQDLPEAERREKGQEMMKAAAEETQKALKDLLKPAQLQRFNQISLQQRGVGAFADPEVRAKMSFTEDQGKEVQALATSLQTESREIMQNNPGNFEEARKQLEHLRKAKMDKVMALLTPDQKKTWKELTGEPFEVKFEPRRPAGGGR